MKKFSLTPALFFLWLFLFSKFSFAANINLELLDSSDFYTIKVDISNLQRTDCKDKTCFLQGMFTFATGVVRYFGYTFGQNDWFPYTGSPDSSFIKSNFVPFDTNLEGSWSGIIRLSLKKDDPDYKGSGRYLVKVKRYIGENSSAATDDSNQLYIEVNDPTPTQVPTATETSTQTPTPTPSPTASPTPSPTSTKTPTSVPTVQKTPTQSPPTSTLLSPTTNTKPSTPSNTNSSSVIPGSDPESILIYSSDSSNSSPFDILGDSTTSSSLESSVNSSSSGHIHSTRSGTNIFKYISVFGVVLASIAGVLLYLRFNQVKI